MVRLSVLRCEKLVTWGLQMKHFFTTRQVNNEPIHVHVEKGDAEAKIWMNLILEQYAYGFKPRERKEIMRLAKEHSEEIIKSWNEHFKK